ncbi:J domain-containing protein [Ilumatobacter sp.]|uniref:J domain-containing protein n=1 Tax=Ilumatobacter sp. TaxID=1967498 RepID=UPI003C48B4C6
MPSPHSILGLTPDASADEIRSARRALARVHHPDAGGDAAEMQRINAAAARALELIDTVEPASETSQAPADPGWIGETRDIPSFTVEALPVDAFEALLVAAAELGEVADDDPPYELRAVLGPPLTCWCQLDLVPDAGAATVSVSIAAVDGHSLPRLIDVRNAWIDTLNNLGERHPFA